MTTTPTTEKPAAATTNDNQKRADAHKKVAGHLETAAKHHTEAAKYYEAGEIEKASENAITAQENTFHAAEAQKEIAQPDISKN